MSAERLVQSTTPPGSTRRATKVAERRAPVQERSRLRVEAILDAAERLVVKHGVDALTTRDIADAAGVPVASLYQYFADKEAVLVALAERHMAEMDEQAAADVAALEELTVATLVRAAMGAFVAVYARRPAFVEIYLRGRTNPRLHAYGRAHNQRIAATLRSVAIEAGVARGDLPEHVVVLAVELRGPGCPPPRRSRPRRRAGRPGLPARLRARRPRRRRLGRGGHRADDRLPRALRDSARSGRAMSPADLAAPADPTAARTAVALASRRLAAEGLLVGTAGNVSMRVGRDRFAVTASGVVLAACEPRHVVIVDGDGVVVDGALQPTSELGLHLGVYADREDAGAVVHTHAPFSTAVACVRDDLPVLHYQQLVLGGAIRVAPYATFGSAELADAVRSALEGRQAALMGNHGSIAVGTDLDKAVEHALLLEWLCALHHRASALGTPRALTDAEQHDVILAALARNYGTVKENR
ncbi:class II aldolase/adducin family protein [Nocardioides sp. R-C-SC26]|uniref:class II aldolase/adducin family protein n=1 Tax=Nocardioides sp. R-C-SC26 TaxID=2870414 RepID=UPI001E36D870|nr:class II aldolase/adducin family protein [Nocardioides sp. R-C-SC26]